MRVDPAQGGSRLDRGRLEDPARSCRPGCLTAPGEDDRADQPAVAFERHGQGIGERQLGRDSRLQGRGDRPHVAAGRDRVDGGEVDGRGRVAGSRPRERRLEDPLVGALANDDDMVGAGAAAEVGDQCLDDLVGVGRARQALEDPGQVLGLRASIGCQLRDGPLVDDRGDTRRGDRSEDDQAEWTVGQEHREPGQAEQRERAGEEAPGRAESGVGGPAREGFERGAEGAGHVLQRMK